MSGLSRVQLLRPGSQLKFIPEEVLIHGRDFRLLRIGFEAGGLAPQAFQVRTLLRKTLLTLTPQGSLNAPGSLTISHSTQGEE